MSQEKIRDIEENTINSCALYNEQMAFLNDYANARANSFYQKIIITYFWQDENSSKRDEFITALRHTIQNNLYDFEQSHKATQKIQTLIEHLVVLNHNQIHAQLTHGKRYTQVIESMMTNVHDFINQQADALKYAKYANDQAKKIRPTINIRMAKNLTSSDEKFLLEQYVFYKFIAAKIIEESSEKQPSESTSTRKTIYL